MPRTAAWIKKIDAIRASINADPAFAFDRVSIAEKFGVSSRQAANILRAAGREKVGGAYIVSRAKLIAYLDGRETDDSGAREQERRRVLALKLAEIRAAGPRLHAVRSAVSMDETSLPDGVTVTGPGRMEIVYDSPGAVLGVILALAELSETNATAFADSLEYKTPEGEEDV